MHPGTWWVVGRGRSPLYFGGPPWAWLNTTSPRGKSKNSPDQIKEKSTIFTYFRSLPGFHREKKRQVFIKYQVETSSGFFCHFCWIVGINDSMGKNLDESWKCPRKNHRLKCKEGSEKLEARMINKKKQTKVRCCMPGCKADHLSNTPLVHYTLLNRSIPRFTTCVCAE